jgi:hypothetical protein
MFLSETSLHFLAHDHLQAAGLAPKNCQHGGKSKNITKSRIISSFIFRIK